jgi:glyoxylase-like metal-dependent hydrolase (beta-lactamase superfamily II)
MVALEIVQLKTSEMENFSYLIYCPQTRDGAVVDPSMRPQLVLDEAARREVKVRLLLNTHGHQDHIKGNDDILAAGDIKLAAHPDAVAGADIQLGEGMQLPIGNSSVTVMYTPGHAPGSLVFATADAIISGDTLFVSRCGRADLPGSDVRQLYISLQRLKKLPPATRVYPGHDYGPRPNSTIAWELEHNDFIKCPDLESFIALRMG